MERKAADEGIEWKAEDERKGWTAEDEGIGWNAEDKGIGWKEESALVMMDDELTTPPTSNSVAFARPPTNSMPFTAPSTTNRVAFAAPTTTPTLNMAAFTVPTTPSPLNIVAIKAPPTSNIVAFRVPTTPSSLNIVAFTAPTTTPDIVTLTPNVVADLGSQREVRLAGHDEIIESTRQRYLARFLSQQGKKGRFPAPKDGYLVLLRRAALDNRYDKKLQARWEGPFRLGDIAHHGRSGRLYELVTGRLVKIKQADFKDRIHLNDLRVYVSGVRSQEEEVMGVGGVKCDRLDWKGEGAEDGKWVGKGGAVDLGKLVKTELVIFQDA